MRKFYKIPLPFFIEFENNLTLEKLLLFSYSKDCWQNSSDIPNLFP
jgi:hypothetical protein